MPSNNKLLVTRTNDGGIIPVVGYGTWQLANDLMTERSSLAAVKMGYYLIDTAHVYGNQEALGVALEAFEKEPARTTIGEIVADGTPFEVISEEDFTKHKQQGTWVTGKVFVRNYSIQGVRASIEDYLTKCKREYADLYMMHWPGPLPGIYSEEEVKDPKNAETRLMVWRILEAHVAEKRIKSLGVCNFMLKHLKPLVEDVLARKAKGDETAVMPIMNQIELSPGLPPPKDLVDYCREHKIHITGYSTLGSTQGNIRNSEAVQAIAKKVGRSPTQVILRWCLQKGYLVIPRTRSAEHARENLEVVTFKLDDEDMKAIDSIPACPRVCPDPNLIA